MAEVFIHTYIHQVYFRRKAHSRRNMKTDRDKINTHIHTEKN